MMVLTRNRIIFYSLSFIVSLLLTTSSYSQTSLEQVVDSALTTRCLDRTHTSVRIVAVPNGKIIYDYNTSQPLLPASVMKVITTAAALHYLGPEYRFKTRLLHTGQRQLNIIQGDLILRGGGDPRIGTEQLWNIATQLKASGINEVTGNLIIDASFFDDYDRAPSWEVERSQLAYDAKLGALSINFNTIAVHVQPGNRIGEPIRAWLEPTLTYIHLRNQAKTVKQGRNTIAVQRTEKVPGELEISVSGNLPIESKEKIIRLNIDNPTHYAIETFRWLLQQAGVQIHGQTPTVATTPTTEIELFQLLSPPLSFILKELNTFSNNFTAEQIVKTIAAEHFAAPGSHEQALTLIEGFLKQSQVELQNVTIVDGSGLSRNNRMTTRAITDLLTAMYSRFDIGPDFISALRVMGVEDILSNRLHNSPARGKVRGKTGTLNQVSTLAGYVGTPQGKVFAYAIFSNNNRCGPWRADQVEDRIVTAIHNLGDSIGSHTARVSR
jgi:D-alanyl-D-alanine carboxypeptidase/D-alanyl-D-alanine-endopeptidase (penicillin-binding protein 4)